MRACVLDGRRRAVVSKSARVCTAQERRSARWGMGGVDICAHGPRNIDIKFGSVMAAARVASVSLRGRLPSRAKM